MYLQRPGQENTGLLMEDQRIVRMRGDSSLVSQPVTLRLRASVKVQVSSDKKQPNITDAVFTSPENFVVCDTRNQILKAFSFTGQYLDYISDPGPMSVTYLQNQLIWNSQYSIIKVLMYYVLYPLPTEFEKTHSRASVLLTLTLSMQSTGPAES